ncbi:TonB-dependent receptor [Thermophagus sp. OGC60D27]|uniref:TonB-dependent receptor n=1 Tax=Thermophagus sp. OGC60D27 TaxID=3458415 RepID=UPI00403818C5
MKREIFKFIILFAMVAWGSANVSFGQGSTTASVTGRITDQDGNPLPAANITITHDATGTTYGGVSDAEGFYRLPNLNVGGPYVLKASFIGYNPFERGDIYLSLGQTFNVNIVLKEESISLNEVSIVATMGPDYSVFDGNRTGAETVIGNDQINALPTVGRDLTDFTRLTPQASVGDEGFLTVAGINNRYNQILIDGAVNNDVFGLAASGTNGGQTGASPISMDIIDQFQVNIAPYDVRQSGFAGASINAVTKRGTNAFHGTAYYLFRNENLAGKTPTDDDNADRKKLDPFDNKTKGISLGGPIIKNKLFFFANAEQMKDETPLPFNFSNYIGEASEAEMDALADYLRNTYDYEPGEYLNKQKKLESTKLFGRIDWNISDVHKLMIRHSYTKSELTDASASSSYTLGFSNNYMYFPSITNSTTLELKSNFNNYSNDLIITGTFVRDDRDPNGQSFPAVSISDGDGTIYFGSEAYSTANELNQDVISITDNFQIYKGKHTITIGTNNEFASVYNLFMRKAFGEYRFASMEDFYNGMAYQYERGYSLVDDVIGDGSAAAADFNILQLGLYGQDEWQISNDFKLTYGIRFDMPLFLTDPPVDEHFNSETIPMLEAAGWDLEGAKTGNMPKSQILFSPRVGFNYDVSGDEQTQLRGGVGIFTSRLPLVWPGGAFTNSGVVIGGVYQQRQYWNGVTPDIPFNADWQTQYDNSYFGGEDLPYSGQIDLFSEDFKFPQVFRANLAVDQKLPWGLIGTLEMIYSKTLNNVIYYNVNVSPEPEFYLTGADNRPYYSSDKIDDSYTRIMLGTNTNKGYAYNITAQLQKPFDNGLTASIAYTYGHSETMNDATSSQNSSQWRYMETVNGLNNLDLSRSDFDLGHKINGYITYTVEYLKHLKSTFSLYYNGQSGMPFSYSYNDNGGVNGEGENEGNLIYVPASKDEIVFATGDGLPSADEQWDNLNQFIQNDDYLSERRGKYAERNGARAPMSHIFDFKFVQDVWVNVSGSKQTLQFTIDIFNVGNLLNKDWGRRYYVPYGNSTIINFEGFAADGTTPTYSFSRDGDYEPWNIDDSGLNSSRWQAQIGIRYKF